MKRDDRRKGLRVAPARFARLAALAVVLALAGCGSVPDAVNPLTWFVSEPPPPDDADAAAMRARAAELAGATADAPYPTLDSVPPRPTRNLRSQVAEGLIADRENARYTEEQVRQRAAVAERAVPPPPTARPAGQGGRVSAQIGSPAQAQSSQVQPSQVQQSSSQQPVSQQPVSQPPASAPQVADAAAEQRLRAAAERFRRPRIPAAPGSGPESAIGSGPSSGIVASLPPRPSPSSSQTVVVDPTALDQGSVPLAGNGRTHLATIYFPRGGAALGERDRLIIARVANYLKSGGVKGAGGEVSVIGHASQRTASADVAAAERVNFDMSLARAAATAEVLADFGVDPRRIHVEARGAHAPRYEESARTGEMGNQRAEIYLLP